MAKTLSAARQQIISRSLTVEPGLYALVHEGADGRAAMDAFIAPGPGSDGRIDVHPMNAERAGFIAEGEFALINVRQAGDVMTILVGPDPETCTDLRLVGLDGGASGEPDAKTVALDRAMRASGMRPRPVNRLLNLAAGLHLVRFAQENAPAGARLLIGVLSKQQKLIISRSPDGSTELQPGLAAVIDLPVAAQVMFSLIVPGVTPAGFSGIMIEPLPKLLRRGRQAAPKPAPAPLAQAQPAEPPMTGFRILWPDRPLGLDMAVSGYLPGGRSTGAAVMTTAWVRAPDGEVLSGLKCSLIGINRLKWEILARLGNATGHVAEQTGTTVSFADQEAPMTSLSLEVVNAQGDRQPLTIYIERSGALAPLTDLAPRR